MSFIKNDYSEIADEAAKLIFPGTCKISNNRVVMAYRQTLTGTGGKIQVGNKNNASLVTHTFTADTLSGGSGELICESDEYDNVMIVYRKNGNTTTLFWQVINISSLNVITIVQSEASKLTTTAVKYVQVKNALITDSTGNRNYWYIGAINGSDDRVTFYQIIPDEDWDVVRYEFSFNLGAAVGNIKKYDFEIINIANPDKHHYHDDDHSIIGVVSCEVGSDKTLRYFYANKANWQRFLEIVLYPNQVYNTYEFIESLNNSQIGYDLPYRNYGAYWVQDLFTSGTDVIDAKYDRPNIYLENDDLIVTFQVEYENGNKNLGLYRRKIAGNAVKGELKYLFKESQNSDVSKMSIKKLNNGHFIVGYKAGEIIYAALADEELNFIPSTTTQINRTIAGITHDSPVFQVVDDSNELNDIIFWYSTLESGNYDLERCALTIVNPYKIFLNKVNHKIDLNVYIRRKQLLTNKVEKEWEKIDPKLILNISDVGNSYELTPSEPNSFNIKSTSIDVSNIDGEFNCEDDATSLWYPYNTSDGVWTLRHGTLIKIVVNYTDSNRPVLEKNIFEGSIKQINSKLETSSIECLGYQYLINKIEATEDMIILNYEESQLTSVQDPDEPFVYMETVSTLLNGFLSVPEVAYYVDILNIDVPNDINVVMRYRAVADDEITLPFEGESIWEIIKFLCLVGNCVPTFQGNKVSFIPFEASENTVYEFSGLGSQKSTRELISVNSIDSDRPDDVRTVFVETNTLLLKRESSTVIINKFGDQKEEIDLKGAILNADISTILLNLLSRFANPKERVTITTKLMHNLKLMDKVTVDQPGRYSQPTSNLLGEGNIGELILGEFYAPLKINKKEKYLLVDASHQVFKGKSNLTLERTT